MRAFDRAIAEIDWPPDLSDDEQKAVIREAFADMESDAVSFPWWIRWLVRWELRDYRRRNSHIWAGKP